MGRMLDKAVAMVLSGSQLIPFGETDGVAVETIAVAVATLSTCC